MVMIMDMNTFVQWANLSVEDPKLGVDREQPVLLPGRPPPPPLHPYPTSSQSRAAWKMFLDDPLMPACFYLSLSMVGEEEQRLRRGTWKPTSPDLSSSTPGSWVTAHWAVAAASSAARLLRILPSHPRPAYSGHQQEQFRRTQPTTEELLVGGAEREGLQGMFL